MKKIAFLLFTFLLPIVAYGEKVKVNLVKEGTLESVLASQVVTNITELEITGRFTAADIIYLRKAEGKVANLEQLDLRGVTLVASDEPYNTTSGTANDDLYGSTLTRYYYLSDREEVETNQTAGKMGGANYHHYYYTMSLAGAFQDMLLEKVVLPEGMKKIGVNCFNGCKILETVVIPSSVEMIEWEAFLDDISLTTVNLEGIKEMGNSAFSGCTSLTSANLVSLEKSDILAFNGCTTLTTVSLPKLAEVPSCTFEGCTSLSGVALSDNVKTIAEKAFMGCTALETIDLPEGLEMIEHKAFYQSGLKSLTLPNTVKKIGDYAFYECKGLESLTLSNSLESIGQNAFEGCYLTTIDFPASLKSIGSSAFYSTKLESVVFTKGDGGLTIGANAFSVYSLTSVTFAEGLETIEENAFRRCQITNVELPEGLKSIGSYCFYDCSKLSSVTLPSTLHYVGTGAFGNTQWVKVQLAEDDGIIYYGSVAYSYTKNTEVDESITIKDGTRGIGEYFAYGKKINAVEFPSTIEFIGNEAFKGTNIKKLIFNEGLEEISGSAFAGCSQLAEIELPSTLRTIGKYAFSNCTSLTKIVIPEGVEQLGVSSYGAFDGCSSITQFTLNAKNLSKESSIGKLENIAKLIIGGEVQVLPSKFVTTSGNLRVSFLDRSSESTLFIGNKSLPYDNMTTLTLPNCKIELDDWAFGGVKIPIEIPGIITAMGEGSFCGLGMSGSGVKGSIRLSEDITTLDDGAFASCKGITSISLPNTITSISRNTFYNCSSLSSIELPSKLESIEYGAFNYCSSLTSIKLPASVTSIGEKAFYYCSSLESVEMPEGLRSIGEYAFADCQSLSKVVFTGDIPASINSKFFEGVGTAVAPATLVVPEQFKANYQAKFDGNMFYGGYFTLEGVVFKKGDLNGDGEVNNVDLVNVLTLIMNGKYETNADLNGDGVVNVADVVELVKIINSGNGTGSGYFWMGNYNPNSNNFPTLNGKEVEGIVTTYTSLDDAMAKASRTYSANEYAIVMYPLSWGVKDDLVFLDSANKKYYATKQKSLPDFPDYLYYESTDKIGANATITLSTEVVAKAAGATLSSSIIL